MPEYAAKRNPDRCPSDPGALLREALQSIPLGKVEFAEALGISRQYIHDIINEKKPVTPATAVRLGKLLGNGSGVWLRMQTAYNLWHVERETTCRKLASWPLPNRARESVDRRRLNGKGRAQNSRPEANGHEEPGQGG
jgi:addiction module HigA family antidote